jgi:hypothetical protein
MKAYKIKVDDQAGAIDAPRVAWAGTQADSKRAKRELAEAHGLGPLSKLVAIEEVDVPTDKQGLLAFLNDNVKE